MTISDGTTVAKRAELITSNHVPGCIQKFPDWVDNEIYAHL
jgi:hypothetical protein